MKMRNNAIEPDGHRDVPTYIIETCRGCRVIQGPQAARELARMVRQRDPPVGQPRARPKALTRLRTLFRRSRW